MMVRVPSCNIDRLIYIWRMEIKLIDTRTPLHICRQGLPLFILISNNLIVEKLRKEASGTNWPGGHCRCRQSPCLRSVRPPTTTTPHSYSPFLIFLEISLVFTHGITPARVNHNKCFIKKMHLDVPCNARILLVLLQKTKLVMMVCLPSVVCAH